ncbi:MAG TPA: asparagine synthase-related protein [Thermomicrobiales bacterium]|nr:asparagine synthase-related protein [Thermomicrobiales bacterium]
MTTSPDLADRLQDALIAGIAARPADALLLSGGVDSSLLAAIATEQSGPTPVAITISLDSAPIESCPVHGANLAVPCNSDHSAARDVAAWLSLNWQPIRITIEVAVEALLDLCLSLRSFDLGNLNNIALHVGTLRATRFGAERIWTGDDADSLFGGYRFLENRGDWRAYLDERIPTIRPPYTDIATITGATPVFPWLHPDVLRVARSLDRGDVLVDIPVAERPGPPSFMDQFEHTAMDAETRTWGKVPLRRLAARHLPEDIAWRPKTDLEFGSGMCALESHLAGVVTPDDRGRLDHTGIRFFNDAHRGLYLRWLDAGGAIRPPGAGEYACASCGGGVANGRSHCPTCGAWPANESPRS